MTLEIGVIHVGKCDSEQIMKAIADFAGLELEQVTKASQQLKDFTFGFESQYPNLKNLKIVYGEELRKMKLTQ